MIYHSLVKLDHVIYKQNGYVALGEQDKGPEYDAVQVTHKGCRLGKWYYESDEKDLYSNSQAYKALEDPHARVHSSVHRALELIDQNWQNDESLRQRIVEEMRATEDASEEVMHWIDQMTDDRMKQLHLHQYQSHNTQPSLPDIQSRSDIQTRINHPHQHHDACGH